VFLAALVGMDNETKMGILGSLARKLKRGTLVVARSARGLRSVLYPVRLLYGY
jgi:nicotianamine synthase